MFLGRSVVYWIFLAFIACLVFFLAVELIPLLFSVIDVSISARLVKLLSAALAASVFWYGGWGRGLAA